MLIRRRFLGQGQGALASGGAWSPLSLTGIQAYFDPATSNMWQDLARTTPVTATGQDVYSIESRTGGIYAEHAGSNPPTYEEDGNGPHLLGDAAVASTMSYTISAGFAVNQAIFAAVVRGGTDTSSVVAAFINGDANNHLRIVAQSSSRYDFFKRLLAYSSLGSQQGWGISSAGDFATAEPLAAIAINGSNDETSVGYANGSERTGLTYTTAQMTSAFPLGTSVRLDACGGLATKTYAWGAASAAPSSGEITELNALLAAKCGATLV